MDATSVFATLSTIDCKKHIETKPAGNGKSLSYLSWAWAWQILKEKYPSATYTIYENKDGLNYHTDGYTCWVKTGVTVEGIEHIEYLPVMDYRNASIPVGKVTSFDVNKSIQRSLTKAVARHGLGLYVYAGEDIPDPYDDELRAMVSTYEAPQTATPPQKDERPWMTEGQLKSALERINSGLLETLDKCKETMRMKKEYRERLENAVTDYKINNNMI